MEIEDKKFLQILTTARVAAMNIKSAKNSPHLAHLKNAEYQTQILVEWLEEAAEESHKKGAKEFIAYARDAPLQELILFTLTRLWDMGVIESKTLKGYLEALQKMLEKPGEL